MLCWPIKPRNLYVLEKSVWLTFFFFLETRSLLFLFSIFVKDMDVMVHFSFFLFYNKSNDVTGVIPVS